MVTYSIILPHETVFSKISLPITVVMEESNISGAI